MPKLYMLVGFPGSGKSTFAKDLKGEVLSTDSTIESAAFYSGKTYNQEFNEWIDIAQKTMYSHLQEILDGGLDYDYEGNKPNIIWDQTNLTAKSRRSKLAKIPDNYEKIAVIFDVPDDVLLARNEERKAFGRDIPENVFKNMLKNFDIPTKAEGFDKIYLIIGG